METGADTVPPVSASIPATTTTIQESVAQSVTQTLPAVVTVATDDEDDVDITTTDTTTTVTSGAAARALVALSTTTTNPTNSTSSTTTTTTTTSSSKRHGKKRKKILIDWKKEEDQKLKDAISHQSRDKQTTIPSEYDWKSISTSVTSRTPDECLDRYMQKFHDPAPAIKSRFWTIEEERIIVQIHAERDTDWGLMSKEISKKLGRSRRYEDIKNRWFSTVRSADRCIRVQGHPSQTAGLLFCYCCQLLLLSQQKKPKDRENVKDK